MNTVLHIYFLVMTFFCLYTAVNVRTLWKQIVFHSLFIGCAIVLFTHKLDLIKNLKIFDAVKFSFDSHPYTMYLNYDKPFVGLFIFIILGFGPGKLSHIKIIKNVFRKLIPCAVILCGTGYLFNYIKFDPKIPVGYEKWMLNNLFLVCVAEEAFFRRYIQRGLEQLFSFYIWGNSLSLAIASIAFGLAHFSGGSHYVILSTIAGLFYGLAYQKNLRLEAAIFVHFLVNCIHFFFFSYPFLEL